MNSKSVIDKLIELGYRMTPQRMMILDAVQSADNHISAEDIYSQITIKYPHVNISTVYRTLELLKELKLVTETNLGEGRVRYHWSEHGHHHHLVCQKCGAVYDLDDNVFSSLTNILIKNYQFVPELNHMAIFGRCLKCKE